MTVIHPQLSMDRSGGGGSGESGGDATMVEEHQATLADTQDTDGDEEDTRIETQRDRWDWGTGVQP